MYEPGNNDSRYIPRVRITGIYPRENRKKGNREKKEERKTKRCLHREQTVATGGNRPSLLTWEGVLEETTRRLRKERGFCIDCR